MLCHALIVELNITFITSMNEHKKINTEGIDSEGLHSKRTGSNKKKCSNNKKSEECSDMSMYSVLSGRYGSDLYMKIIEKMARYTNTPIKSGTDVV